MDSMNATSSIKTNRKVRTSNKLLLAIALAVIGLSLQPITIQASATVDQLNAQIASLKAQVQFLTTDQQAAFVRLHARISPITQSLVLALPEVSVKRGNSITLPLTILPGNFLSAGLQGDVIIPAGFTLNSITLGQAALDAGKGINTNLVNGNMRFIISGFNQTVIQPGVVANIKFTVAPTAFPTIIPIQVISPSASDISGNTVPISILSGNVAVGS